MLMYHKLHKQVEADLEDSWLQIVPIPILAPLINLPGAAFR